MDEFDYIPEIDGATLENSSSINVGTTRKLDREEFEQEVSRKLTVRYSESFNTLDSYVNYANTATKMGSNRSATSLFGAVKRPEDINMTKKEVKANPVFASFKRDMTELSQVAYEVYNNEYTRIKGTRAERQVGAAQKANRFLHQEIRNLSKFSNGIPSEADRMKFHKSLGALSTSFGANSSGYESGRLGYIPYPEGQADYGIGPLITPIDRGLDIGNWFGAALTRIFDKTLSYKVGVSLLPTDAKYQRAALLENTYQGHDSMIEGYTGLVDALGYAAMFGEMALVSSISGGAATPGAVAAQTTARAGTWGIIGYSVMNGGFNDYIDSIALSRKYFKGNPLQDPYTDSFIYSRLLEIGTAYASYSFLGPKISEKLLNRVLTEKVIWSDPFITGTKLIGTLAIDSGVDTAFDFYVYGVARNLDQGEGTVLTEQDYRMFAKENIFKVLTQRALMRVSNAGVRSLKYASSGLDTGWGRKAWFKETYPNSKIGSDKFGASLARFTWRLVDAISPNHYKEMDQMFQSDGGLVAKIKKNGGKWFDYYTYASFYNYFEYETNNAFAMFRNKENMLPLMKFIAGKDVTDFEYVVMRDNKQMDIQFVDANGRVDTEMARTVGAAIRDSIEEIYNMKDSNGEELTEQAKDAQLQLLKRRIINSVVSTYKDIDLDNNEVTRVRLANAESFDNQTRRAIAEEITNEITKTTTSDARQKQYLNKARAELFKELLAVKDINFLDESKRGQVAFVDGMMLRFNKTAKGKEIKVVFSDTNKISYSETDFADLKNSIFQRHEEFKEYMQRAKDRQINKGNDVSALTLSEIGQMVILPDKFSVINKMTYDIIENIMKGETDPAKISPETMRNEVFRKDGILDQYKDEIRVLIERARSFESGTGKYRLTSGKPYSKDMVIAQINDILGKYSAATIILGNRVNRESIDGHRESLAELLGNSSYKEYLNYNTIKDTKLGELFDTYYTKNKDEQFATKFSTILFAIPIANRINSEHIMTLFMNSHFTKGKESASRYMAEETGGNLYNLEVLSMISHPKMERILRGVEFKIKVKQNGKERVVTLDSDHDPHQLFLQKTSALDPWDEKLFLHSLLKLDLLGTSTGESLLRDVLQDEELLDDVKISWNINSGDMEVEIVRAPTRDKLINLYGRAYREFTGYRTYDEDDAVLYTGAGDQMFITTVAGKKNVFTTYSDIINKFASIDGKSTYIEDVGFAMVGMGSRRSTYYGLRRMFSETNPKVYNQLRIQDRRRLVRMFQNHLEMWHGTRTSLGVSRFMSDKYGLDLSISIISTSQVRVRSNTQMWAVRKPDLTNKDGSPNKTERVKWGQFIKQAGLLSIGEAKAGQEEVFIRLPAGTDEQQKRKLAESLYDMQAHGEGLNKGMITFRSWMNMPNATGTGKNFSNEQQVKFANGSLSYNKMLDVFVKYMRHRFSFDEELIPMDADSKIDVTRIAAEWKRKGAETKDRLEKILKILHDKSGDIAKTDEDALGFEKEMAAMFRFAGSPQLIALLSQFPDASGFLNKKHPDQTFIDETRKQFKDAVDLLDEFRSIEQSAVVEEGLAEMRAWMDTELVSRVNTAEQFLRELLSKQSNGIFGNRDGKTLTAYMKHLKEGDAKKLLYRTLITGVESTFYGLDWAKRFGLMVSNESLFTKTNGELKDHIKDYLGELSGRGVKMRLIYFAPGEGPGGVKASGAQGVPGHMLKAMNHYISSNDAGQKLAFNLFGFLHKGVYIRNDNFEGMLGNNKLTEHDIILNADDTKNVTPEMFAWMRANDVSEDTGAIVVDIDTKTAEGREVMTNIFKGLTVQQELSSTARDRGVGVLISTIVPSSHGQVNRIIDDEFNIKWFDRIKANLYDQVMFGSITQWTNALSKNIRAGVKTPGVVSVALPQLRKINEDSDLVLKGLNPKNPEDVFINDVKTYLDVEKIK